MPSRQDREILFTIACSYCYPLSRSHVIKRCAPHGPGVGSVKCKRAFMQISKQLQVLHTVRQPRLQGSHQDRNSLQVMNDASNPTGRRQRFLELAFQLARCVAAFLERHAIQFLAECLRDKAELKMNFKHVVPCQNFLFSSRRSSLLARYACRWVFQGGLEASKVSSLPRCERMHLRGDLH